MKDLEVKMIIRTVKMIGAEATKAKSNPNAE
jgi:hypothetical protein